MGEMSTAKSLPAVMISAAVGTLFGIWRRVDARRHRAVAPGETTSSTCGIGAASVRAGVVGRRASGVSRCAVVVRARFLRSFLESAASAPVVAPRWPDGPARRPSLPGSGEGAGRVHP